MSSKDGRSNLFSVLIYRQVEYSNRFFFYFWVIQAGKLDTRRRLVSSDGSVDPGTEEGAGVGAGMTAAAGVGVTVDTGAMPFGLIPYGLGVPGGGDQAP